MLIGHRGRRFRLAWHELLALLHSVAGGDLRNFADGTSIDDWEIGNVFL